MWENIWNMATQSGIWAVLFVVLFYKQIKESKEREERYQETIDSLADKLKTVVEIRNDIKDLKQVVCGDDFRKKNDLEQPVESANKPDSQEKE